MNVENMTIIVANSFPTALGESKKDDRNRGDIGRIAVFQPEAPTASDIEHLDQEVRLKPVPLAAATSMLQGAPRSRLSPERPIQAKHQPHSHQSAAIPDRSAVMAMGFRRATFLLQ